MAGEIMGTPTLLTLRGISPQSTIQQSNRILSDPSHVLNPQCVLMNSGMRYRLPFVEAQLL